MTVDLPGYCTPAKQYEFFNCSNIAGALKYRSMDWQASMLKWSRNIQWLLILTLYNWWAFTFELDWCMLVRLIHKLLMFKNCICYFKYNACIMNRSTTFMHWLIRTYVRKKTKPTFYFSFSEVHNLLFCFHASNVNNFLINFQGISRK